MAKARSPSPTEQELMEAMAATSDRAPSSLAAAPTAPAPRPERPAPEAKPPIACATCVYWVSTPNGIRAPNNEPMGQCRRLPPTVQRTDQGIRSMFPLTLATWWWGEHAYEEMPT